MAQTVQKLVLQLAQLIDPHTKNSKQTFNDVSAALTVSGATNATPIVITTTTNHNLKTGDVVYIVSVAGNTNANNTAANPAWTITKASATTFSLDGSSGNGNYTSGGTCTPAMICSADGDKLTRQRLLDIYNQARFVLANQTVMLSKEERTRIIAGLMKNKADLTFTAGVAALPSGYIGAVSLTDNAGARISILPLENQDRIKNQESATNRFVFRIAFNLETISTNTYVPNAANYVLRYYEVVDWTLAQVLAGTVTELFHEESCYWLLEVAEAIYAEQGEAQLNALAQKLIGVQNGTK